MQHELEERLRFETLLVEISASFVNLPPDRIDGVIEYAQRLICECLGLDLSALWQWSVEKPHFMTLTHLHSPPDGPVRPVNIDAAEAFPWILQKMVSGETLAISTAITGVGSARSSCRNLSTRKRKHPPPSTRQRSSVHRSKAT